MKFKFVWEQRKLKELGNIKRGASPRPISDPKWFDENGKYGWLRISDVTSQNGQVFQIDQHLSSIGEEKTVLISSPHLIISIAATVGKPCINYIPTAIHDGFVAFLDYKFNLDFMFEWFNKNQNIWLKYGQPGAQINLNSSIIGNQKIKIPEENEQEKIAKLFNILNNLLALYENKRKLLTALSQGLSQYLFSFSKEKNAIQMSLSSITVSETKGIAKENTLSLGNIEYLDTTRLNGGKAKLVSGKKDVDFRDIIVLWDGSNAGKIYYGFSGILGSTLKVFKLKDDINSEYVYYYLKFKQSLILHKFRTPNIPHVSKDFSQRFNLPIPDKEKQNLIANILHLNELQINLINKKIEKLKQIKESLLQNMFL